MSEDELLTQILELAALRGWRAFHVRDSRRGIIQGPGGVGFPDLVLGGVGHTGSPAVLYRELKDERRGLEPAQEAWRDLLLAAGADWALWRPSDWREIEATIRDIRREPFQPATQRGTGRPAASLRRRG